MTAVVKMVSEGRHYRCFSCDGEGVGPAIWVSGYGYGDTDEEDDTDDLAFDLCPGCAVELGTMLIGRAYGRTPMWGGASRGRECWRTDWADYTCTQVRTTEVKGGIQHRRPAQPALSMNEAYADTEHGR